MFIWEVISGRLKSSAKKVEITDEQVQVGAQSRGDNIEHNSELQPEGQVLA